jgi:hypothetical protein
MTLVCDKCHKRIVVTALHPVLLNKRHSVISRQKRPIDCDGILRAEVPEDSG